MDGKGARKKGQVGEREFLKLLTQELRLEEPLTRNLEQVRFGGFDNRPDQLEGFAVEIRRREQLSLGSWWETVVDEALAIQNCPVLAYRQSRQPWRVQLPFFVQVEELLTPQLLNYSVTPITTGIDSFAQIVQELDPTDSSAAHHHHKT